MMNKKFKEGFREGAEAVGNVAGKTLEKVAGEIDITNQALVEHTKTQHEINDALICHAKKQDFGFLPILDAIDTMSSEEKSLLISALSAIKDSCDNPSEMTQSYFKSIYILLDAELHPSFKASRLELVEGKYAECFMYFLVEYRSFFADESALHKAQELMGHIVVSASKRKEIESLNADIVGAVGLEGILGRLENRLASAEVERLKQESEHLIASKKKQEYADKKRILEEQASASQGQDENGGKSHDKDYDKNNSSFTLPTDNTSEMFPELRELVLSYIPKIYTLNCEPAKLKSINGFIDKNSLKISTETVIACIDQSVSGKGKSGILFTTHAMYFNLMLEKPVKLAYKDIRINYCKLEFDKKGRPNKLHIESAASLKGISVDNVSYKPDAFLEMLAKIVKLNDFSVTDEPMPISKMDFAIKLPYLKYLVNFMAQSRQSYIEVKRFAFDIGLSDGQYGELRKYIRGDSKESNEHLLLQINDNAPYGSRKSLKYALIADMYSVLQFAKGSSSLSPLEYEFISKTVKVYGFTDKDAQNIKVMAQAKYDILIGKIKKPDDLKPVEKAMSALAMGAGVPLVALVGSSFVFAKVAIWFAFIPGIGKIIAGTLGVAGIVWSAINKNKNNKEFLEQVKKLRKAERTSYHSAIERIKNLFPETTGDIALLKKHCDRFLERSF